MGDFSTSLKSFFCTCLEWDGKRGRHESDEMRFFWTAREASKWFHWPAKVDGFWAISPETVEIVHEWNSNSAFFSVLKKIGENRRPQEVSVSTVGITTRARWAHQFFSVCRLNGNKLEAHITLLFWCNCRNYQSFDRMIQNEISGEKFVWMTLIVRNVVRKVHVLVIFIWRRPTVLMTLRGGRVKLENFLFVLILNDSTMSRRLTLEFF